jgi:hypothetical protein
MLFLCNDFQAISSAGPLIGLCFPVWSSHDRQNIPLAGIAVRPLYGPLLAIECKTGHDLLGAQTLRVFRSRFPKVPLVVASLHDHVPRLLETGIELLPWAKVLERYQALS